MEESKNKLVELTAKVVELSKEMEKSLIEFTKKAGGKIDTCNNDRHNDTIYAYVWDEVEETYLEKKVIEVEAENDNLVITLDYGLSTEEDCKYTIFGGLILINATLYNLCDYLWEYVDIKE
jgi:hypothetical protein